MSLTQIIDRSKAKTSETPATVYKFERRRYERRPAEGRVSVLRRNHEAKTYRHPVCLMTLINTCEGGVLATCDIPLDKDESVVVMFPPHGAHRGYDVYGHVIRCLPAGHGCGYEVAIAYDVRKAA